MTADRLGQIKERLADATPGPWGWSGCANDRVDVCSKAPGWEDAEIAVVTVDYELNNREEFVEGMPVMDRAMAHSNGALIMHAPEDLRELVAEVERLREAVRKVHALAEMAVGEGWCFGIVGQTFRDIHEITKGMVE